MYNKPSEIKGRREKRLYTWLNTCLLPLNAVPYIFWEIKNFDSHFFLFFVSRDKDK